MDFMNMGLNVLTASKPGMWEIILNSFKGALGTYMLAVILLAVLVRIVFSLVDIVNKKVTMKTTALNEKMKPELEAIQKKYGHDKALVQQKTNELYKKYQFNVMGGCLPMLVSMVLQFVVFLTLWTSLQSMANFNIAQNYENMKNVYANVINLNSNVEDFSNFYHEGDQLSITVDIQNKTMTLKNNTTNDVRADLVFKEDFSNQEMMELLEKYVIVPETENPPVEGQADEGTEENPEVTPAIEYVDTGFNEIFKKLAEQASENFYLQNQEGFLWIKNVYKSESPTSPLFTKDEIKSYLSSFYSEEEKQLETDNDFEGKIFDYVVTAGIGQKDLGHNGYYILTIIAVLSSFFSIWLSNKLMKNKNNPANGAGGQKMMYFIMPIIFGIFTFMYTSLFAIYIIVGQLAMIALTPLTTWVVKKWNEHDANKKRAKEEIVVDYRRKDK